MASQLTRRVLRVFLASPGDLIEERMAAERVVASLNKTIGRRLQWHIDLHKWEDKTPGMGRPQSIINPDVDQCDLFVGLLWEHWGHATGKYSSGFEEEFERARARHQEMGEPQIWLVFKEPRREKLTDPGPQLSDVLTFKEKQTASNEILYFRVNDANEWERDFSHWLTDHVLGLYLAGESVQPPVTSSPAVRPSTSNEGGELEDLLTGSKGRATEQIAQEFQILGKLIASDQLEFSPGDEELLKEFDAARLHLLSSTWMSRRYTGDVLGVHEINQLYRYRSELQTAPPEIFLILRTLVDDSSDVVPAWFWFRQLKLERLSFLLFSMASNDSLPHLRAQAIGILRASGIQPPNQHWDLLSLADQPVTVQWAVYDYLGTVADFTAIPVLEELARTLDENMAEAAYRARLQILARLDPERGFSDLLAKPDYASEELLRRFQVSISKIKTETLNEGIASLANKIRELSATELAKRGFLTITEAEKLTQDIWIPIRKIGFDELIRRGKPVDLDKIKESFSENKESGRLRRMSDLFGGLGAPSPPNYSELAHSVVLAFLRTLPPSELLRRVDWLDPHGALAYRCLATDHYEVISEYIRDDIEQGFQRIRAATFERLDAQYRGAEGLEQLKADIEKLDGFVREEFLEGALIGLASHANPSDLGLARSYLDHRRQGVRAAAMEIVSRFGTSEDAPALIAISKEHWGELGEKAALISLQLSSNPFEVAKTFTTSHTPEIATIGFRWLLQDNSTATKQLFENLLNDENGVHRERAVHYLTKWLTESEMQRFLDDYLARESYYYDVVTWLDRFLYAPPPFGAMYRRRLAEKM